MLMRAGNNSSGPARWLIGSVVSALLIVGPSVCWSSPHHRDGGRGGARGFQSQESHEHRGQQEQGRPENHNRDARPQEPGRETREAQPMRQTGRTGGQFAYRRGQEHLPAWWQTHRELSPRQQADALRRQPGFQSLPRRQQQRLIQRLHEFDRRPPQQQRRMLDRMESFERLSPERQQEVRGASQALSQMPPARQRIVRQAFRDLRQMPPDERREMLHSGYGAQFTPQERTVLGNLLSIEPYQPQGQMIQPYFGRR
ncbi:MAG: DUF3106 domain-containing protein [Acidobacteriaceae bacterium]